MPAAADDADALAAFIARHRRVLVLTGAGCSTASGIPAYRDDAGEWAHPPPVQYRDFLEQEATRRRYWARSAAGWPRIAAATPNPAHRALATLEQAGAVAHLVTQNVDGLHQRAGSRRVTELHGSLHLARCLDCGARVERTALQARLTPGPAVPASGATARPDGDADLHDAMPADWAPPACEACGGTLKPDVVFFGEAIPPAVSAAALAELERADALLVVGSSLMVFSGFRFARAAAAAGKPVAALNLGRTRADGLLALRVTADCTVVLPEVARRVAGAPVS